MKSFMRFCGITALILLGGGLGLTVAGCILGGMTRVANVADVLNAVMDDRIPVDRVHIHGPFGMVEEEVSLIEAEEYATFLEQGEFLEQGVFGAVFEGDVVTVVDGTVKNRLDCKDVENLKVDAGGCDFRIEISSDQNFWLEVQDGKSQPAVMTKGDTLYVTMDGIGLVSGSADRNRVITLFVPKNFGFEDVDLELGAGRLTIDELNARKAKMEVGAGDLTVGVMQIGKLDCQVGVGNIEIIGKISGDVEAECAMGNITLKLLNKKKDFNYSLECSMGNINLDGERYSGISTAKKINNGAEQKMKLECAMGNIEVKFE